MSKILLYRQEAREAMARGVMQFARALDGTIGPKGGNGIIDVPLGTPIVTRDGVRIAQEIELDDPFENAGVQIVREASRQTNEVAGDGTTTAAVLANALVQFGLKKIGDGANAVDVVRGIEHSGKTAVAAMREEAVPVRPGDVEAVARVAANDPELGKMVADAQEQVGLNGIVDVESGQGDTSVLEVVNGFTFDRGYLSHHLSTETDTMESILPKARVLLTDAKIKGRAQLEAVLEKIGTDEPLLIIAEQIDADALAALIGLRDHISAPVVAVHPPEFGRWREAMMEDLAVITGGKFICAHMGRYIEDLTPADLGVAEEVRTNEEKTVITGGGGDPTAIEGRRDQAFRQLQVMEQPVERDKLEERLAQIKSGGGKAVIYVGGFTAVERRRREHLVEDAINATHHAMAEGVVPGGGMALVKAARAVKQAAQSLPEAQAIGAGVVAEALLQPLRCIAENCGADAQEVLSKAAEQPAGYGFDAELGSYRNLLEDTVVVDPVKVPCTALDNAVSVSALILTAQVLIADKPEFEDPTAGVARGGGGENLALERL